MSESAARSARAAEPSAALTPTFLQPTTLQPGVTLADAVAPTLEAELAPLLALRDGVPPVVDDLGTLRDTAKSLAAGTGPVAVDAERASSYRYGHRAYLVQLRRDGAGSFLIDPIGCPDLTVLGDAIGDAEWIVHAANQDLPCLAEVGLRPSSLFDTELAGRLAGFPRVGLATMVENLLGQRMEKSHSAADWSKRPLPEPWLRYAALDVEVLLELRELLEAELDRQHKLEWAREEFEHVRTTPAPATPVDRWRKVSGVHRVRGRRQLAVVRAMWQTRDRIARAQDVSPSRLLPDASIIHVASALPKSAKTLAASQEFVGRGARRHLDDWWQAIEGALALPESELPQQARHTDGPPPAHRWAERDRPAADRLVAAKAAVAALADEHQLPAENLLAPDSVRRLAWQPPQPLEPVSVGDALRELGAREWQVALVAGPLARAMSRAQTHTSPDRAIQPSG
jgi:ribonuclease D